VLEVVILFMEMVLGLRNSNTTKRSIVRKMFYAAGALMWMTFVVILVVVLYNVLAK
jgi:hypothetical protein